MSKPAYPVGSDLRQRLTSAGAYSSSQHLALDDKIASAVQAWEDATNYHPFLSTGTPATRHFDAPGPNRGLRYGGAVQGGGRNLLLRTGLLALTSLAIDGVSKTVNTDFWLGPAESEYDGTPYTEIEFAYPVWCQRRGIAINATWGYSATVPDDVFEAVLCKAARQALLDTPVTSFVTAQEEDGFRQQFSSSNSITPTMRLNEWQSYFESKVLRYRLYSL